MHSSDGSWAGDLTKLYEVKKHLEYHKVIVHGLVSFVIQYSCQKALEANAEYHYDFDMKTGTICRCVPLQEIEGIWQ